MSRVKSFLQFFIPYQRVERNESYYTNFYAGCCGASLTALGFVLVVTLGWFGADFMTLPIFKHLFWVGVVIYLAIWAYIALLYYRVCVLLNRYFDRRLEVKMAILRQRLLPRVNPHG
jgi:hypothetical protein